MFISTDNDCSKFTVECVETEHELVSNQEEDDTKVVLHSINALNRDKVSNIIIRSPSGDIDIIVIIIGLLIWTSKHAVFWTLAVEIIVKACGLAMWL